MLPIGGMKAIGIENSMSNCYSLDGAKCVIMSAGRRMAGFCQRQQRGSVWHQLALFLRSTRRCGI
jgi:hypothetical protein